ncbi:EH signature domain-containing protein [uncultured Thalassolituus sp.]|uniref:EH signature domain-containing protein n=1 Tax=uncultured Thalassolituus sp. TaxID=285273 RepID=UPI0035A70503
MGLLNYTSGRFLAVAKNIHYLATLRSLKPGEDHRVLKEVQKSAVYDSLYEDGFLLGHEVLKILISRAEEGHISDKWMNVIMAIAGDPRVSKQNERYIRWWSQMPESLIRKVRGWLSKLDLRLFLEALKNYAVVSNDQDLSRMYPSRKKFLEGLLKQELIISTRLFLTEGARDYLYRHYKKEHLPSFSIVDGDKSIIYFSMPGVHIVEGTHMCKFWIYRKLSDSAAVFNYNRNRFVYSELTNGMNLSMVKQKVGKALAAVTHNGSWQVKVLKELHKVGVEFDPEPLLLRHDYIKYRDSGYL